MGPIVQGTYQTRTFGGVFTLFTCYNFSDGTFLTADEVRWYGTVDRVLISVSKGPWFKPGHGLNASSVKILMKTLNINWGGR